MFYQPEDFTDIHIDQAISKLLLAMFVDVPIQDIDENPDEYNGQAIYILFNTGIYPVTDIREYSRHGSFVNYQVTANVNGESRTYVQPGFNNLLVVYRQFFVQPKQAGLRSIFTDLAEYYTTRLTVESLYRFSLEAYSQHQAIRREYGPHSPIEKSAWNYYLTVDQTFREYAAQHGGPGDLSARLQLIQYTPEYTSWLEAYRAELNAKHGISTLQPATFTIDSLPGQYDGYTNGQTWNGWDCPVFKFENAVKVLHASIANGYRYRYNVTDDTFIVWSKGSRPGDYESFPGQMIDGIKVYPIGSGSWIWERL